MEYIKAEAAYIMNLDAEPKPSEHPWPPRLILQNPDHDPKKPTTFANMYADQYRGNIIKTWRLDNATQHRLKDTPTARYTDSGHAATASLRAIVVPSEAHQRHILLMEQDTFLRLFDSMKLDRYGLCLYLTNVPGLHSLGRRSKDSSVLGFFLNAIDYAFIWSYDPKMRATNAVIIGEVDQACKTNQLLGAIKRTENAVVFNPLYLAFLACSEGFLMNCEFDYASVKSPGRRLRGETMDMGHNSTNRELRDFSEASLSHGKSLTNGVRRLRVVQTLQDVVNQLDGSWEGTIWGETAGRVAAMADDDRRSSSAGRTDALQQSNVEIQAAIPWLRSQLACRVAHFEAHIGWAKTSLRVANDRMGSTEARLARQDIRTFAFAIMVFLFATKVATLFDIQTAMEATKRNFKLYWKVAVAVTALVLLCWDVAAGWVLRWLLGWFLRPVVGLRQRWANWRKKRRQRATTSAPKQEGSQKIPTKKSKVAGAGM